MDDSTYNFYDGKGPVPAHKHANGGGWVADSAHVSESAFVGPSACVAGGVIYGGTIEGGTIYDGTILGGVIYGGTIEGGVIYGGTIEGGTIHGGTIYDGTIHGGTIYDGTIWCGTIRGGTIRGGTIRGGTIRGGTIRGGTIRGGTVSRDVTYVTGCIPYDVTIIDDHVGIGCQWWTPTHWKDNGVAIFENHGQTPEDARKLHQLLCMFIDVHGCVDAISD